MSLFLFLVTWLKQARNRLLFQKKSANEPLRNAIGRFYCDYIIFVLNMSVVRKRGQEREIPRATCGIMP
jgi:hypothetical protein